MNILVIGGSYFLGKHFVMRACKKHNITVFNRGNSPLNIEGVTEVAGDRHSVEDLSKLSGSLTKATGDVRKNSGEPEFDVIVDFCAYAPGDIETVLGVIFGADGGKSSAGGDEIADSKTSVGNKATAMQYIFISTVDVYEHGLGRELDENAPFESRILGGQEGDYILGKIALEQELRHCSVKYNIKYTSVRPAILYGPDNYAPREAIYFHLIENAGQILHPADSDGEFQFVYVDDAAAAIERLCGNETAYNQAFNLTGPEVVTYNSFADALEQAIEVPITRVEIPVSTVLEKNIPLPFPLTKGESNWYNGDKVLSLIEPYISLEEGMRRTVKAKNDKR